MTDPASITLSNGAVVKVGDVVPLTFSPKTMTVVEIWDDRRVLLRDPKSGWDFLCDDDGQNVTHPNGLPAIDLAALATPGAQAVPMERVLLRELVGLARDVAAYESAPKTHEMDDGEAGIVIEWEPVFQIDAWLKRNAAALEALAKGGDGGK